MKIALILFILSSLSFADTETAICEKEGSKFGDGNGRDSIPAECSEHFLKKVSPKLKKKSKDGTFSVHAYKNIIFIKDPKTKIKGQNIIAGKYTELENIQAIALDEENKEIVVLEESRDILSFSSVITGNMAPKRILKHKDLEDAQELIVYKDQVIVLLSKNEVVFFKREANVHGPPGKKFLSPLRTIRNVKGSELEINEDQLFVIDEENRSRSVFDLKTMMFVKTEKIPEKKTEQNVSDNATK